MIIAQNNARMHYSLLEDNQPTAGQMMPNLADQTISDISHLSRMNSVRTGNTGMMGGEKRCFLYSGILSINNSNSRWWLSPNSPVPGCCTSQACPPQNGPVNISKSPSLLPVDCTVCRAKSILIFLNEAPQMTRILRDTQDRRIRTICDRF